MANCEVNCCSFIRGEVFIGDAFANCDGSIASLMGCSSNSKPLRNLGNVENLNIFVESEIRGLTSKTNAFETLSCAQTIINNVRLQMKLNCSSTQNLRLALYGDGNDGTEFGTGCEQSFCSGLYNACDFLKFKKCGISNVVVEIRDAVGGVVKLLEEDVDYSLCKSGLTFMNGFSINQNNTLHVTYDFDERQFEITDPLASISGPKTLYFKGLNMDEKEYTVEIYNIVIQPTTQFEIISTDNFQTFDLNGVIMRDCSREEGSQYMKIKQEIVNGNGCS